MTLSPIQERRSHEVKEKQGCKSICSMSIAVEILGGLRHCGDYVIVLSPPNLALALHFL